MTLSEELGRMILSAKASHLAFIKAYVDERRNQANEYIDSVWVPMFMSNLLRDSQIMPMIDTAASDVEKGQLLLEFGTAAAATIEQRRSVLHGQFYQIEWVLDSAVAAHYDDLMAVNTALTAHLRSAAKVAQTRDELMESLRIQPDKLLPLDAIDHKLGDLVKFTGKVEELKGTVNDIHGMLRPPTTQSH